MEKNIRSIIDIYPTSIRLLTEDVVKKRGFPLEPCHRYREAINEIPLARRLLTESRRYLYFKDISLEEARPLFEATDRLIRDLKKLEGIMEDI